MQADCLDWLQKIPEGAPLYLDPPYFVKGDSLYPERIASRPQHFVFRLAVGANHRFLYILGQTGCPYDSHSTLAVLTPKDFLHTSLPWRAI